MAHMLPLSATAGVDGRLLIWDTASLSVRATCQHPEVCFPLHSCQRAGLACSCAVVLKQHVLSFCVHIQQRLMGCIDEGLTMVSAGCCGH